VGRRGKSAAARATRRFGAIVIDLTLENCG
jgi:hypothetical protein